MISGCGRKRTHEYMFEYASKYIDPKYIIIEGKSMTTYQNLVFSFEILENTFTKHTDGHYLFKSRAPNDTKEQKLVTFTDGVRNANKILPGELYHAANPNPRSALIITYEGNVIMVKVEGRDKRGVGMDLAEFCFYLKAKYAINLDGGRSSQLCWKLPNQNFINVSGGETGTQSYLVGSIISLVKKN